MRNGLLLVDKPPGCTSHDVVQRARKLLGEKKIGHCGTLDPTATGLLLLTVGHATRLTRFLIRAPKVYAGRIRFGVETDTFDASGRVTAEHSTSELTTESIRRGMEAFQGAYDHLTPPYSAKKIGGVKYYELARRGETVPEVRKEITVFEFIPASELADGEIEFRLSCSSGTYVRSLVHELGRQLESGAHLEVLRRLQVGSFKVEDAIALDELAEECEAGDASPGRGWIEFDSIPLPFPQIEVDLQQERRLSHGQPVLIRERDCVEGDWLKLVSQRKQFIAVGTVVERIGTRGVGVVQPRIVFR